MRDEESSLIKLEMAIAMMRELNCASTLFDFMAVVSAACRNVAVLH